MHATTPISTPDSDPAPSSITTPDPAPVHATAPISTPDSAPAPSPITHGTYFILFSIPINVETNVNQI